MFDAAHRHELYNFLRNHFQQLTEEEKARVLRIIRDLPLPDRGDNSELIRHDIQRKWFKSIEGKGYEPADSWLSELNDALGESAKFVPADLNIYHETRWGFGPAPHEAQELIAFAQAGTIVDRLNGFVPSDSWDGPSKRSLSDAVIDAVGAAPDIFLDGMPQFLARSPNTSTPSSPVSRNSGTRGGETGRASLGSHLAETYRLLRSYFDERRILGK